MSWRKIWNDPVWSKVISTAIIAATSAIGAWLITRPFNTQLWAITGMTAASIMLLIGIFFLFKAIFRPLVEWKFDGFFLGMVGGGGDIRIISFQASGRNRSGKGINFVKGHLISNMDNSVSTDLHFVIGGTPVLPSETSGVPPGADFQVMVPLCDTKDGYNSYLTESQFLHTWASFRFYVEMDGRIFEKNFSQDEVRRKIDEFKKLANPPAAPQVRRKSKAA